MLTIKPQYFSHIASNVPEISSFYSDQLSHVPSAPCIDSIISSHEYHDLLISKSPISNSLIWLPPSFINTTSYPNHCTIILPSNNNSLLLDGTNLLVYSTRPRDLFGHMLTYISTLFPPVSILPSSAFDYSNVSIYSNVTFQDTPEIGDFTCIGRPGFGFYSNLVSNLKVRMPHLSGVHLGHGCQLSSNITIDAGILYPTSIGNNVKIDSNVHIGHNVIIGDSTIICASTTICGSVSIGNDVFLGAGVIIMDKVSIPSGSIIGLGAVVRKSLKTPSKIIPIFTNKYRSE